MKSIIPTLGVLSVAVIALLYVLSSSQSTEHLSAGIDQTKPSSSYDQKTNHFNMPTYDAGPIDGHETPYKVNQWNSYQV
jgi:hypothetical protein